MKYFILLAIIFFSFRVFSEDTYYYEGRYYKIDEYIRFLDDPNYQSYLQQKKFEKQNQRVGVKEYFAERERTAYIQEQARKAHAAQLDVKKDEAEILALEAAHERTKAVESRKYLALQKQYLLEKEMELLKHKPTRMVASVFETEAEPALKRIPLSKRKYQLKNKVNRASRK